MIELIYVSRPKKGLSQSSVIDLLYTCRKNNSLNDLTGLLLYDGSDVFIQSIEGTAEMVETLFERIKIDRRHSHVSLIVKQDINQRSYPNWHMAYRNIGINEVFSPEDINSYEESEYKDTFFEQHPHLIHKLLHEYKSS